MVVGRAKRPTNTVRTHASRARTNSVATDQSGHGSVPHPTSQSIARSEKTYRAEAENRPSCLLLVHHFCISRSISFHSCVSEKAKKD